MKRLLVLLPLIALLAGCGLFQENRANKIPGVNEYEMGKKAYEQENYVHAVQYQDQWLAKHPNYAAAYVERGRAYDKLGRYDEALLDYSKALEANPSALRPQVYKAGALVAMGRGKEARQNVEAIMLNPGFSAMGPYEQFLSILLDGQFKLQDRDNQAALDSFNSALQIYEVNTTVFLNYKSPHIHRVALRNRAVAAGGLNEFEQAVEDLEEYLKINESYGYETTAEDYKALALAYYMTEQYEKSREILSKLSPQDQEALTAALGHNVSGN